MKRIMDNPENLSLTEFNPDGPLNLSQAAYEAGIRAGLSGCSIKSEPILHGASSVDLSDVQWTIMISWTRGWQDGWEDRHRRIQASAHEDGKLAYLDGKALIENPYKGWLGKEGINHLKAKCFNAWHRGWQDQQKLHLLITPPLNQVACPGSTRDF